MMVDLEKLERAIRELCDIPDSHIIYISVGETDVLFYHGDGYKSPEFGFLSRDREEIAPLLQYYRH